MHPSFTAETDTQKKELILTLRKVQILKNKALENIYYINFFNINCLFFQMFLWRRMVKRIGKYKLPIICMQSMKESCTFRYVQIIASLLCNTNLNIQKLKGTFQLRPISTLRYHFLENTQFEQLSSDQDQQKQVKITSKAVLENFLLVVLQCYWLCVTNEIDGERYFEKPLHYSFNF